MGISAKNDRNRAEKNSYKYTLIGAFKQEAIRRENTISNFSI
jgi:hypothetical protein